MASTPKVGPINSKLLNGNNEDSDSEDEKNAELEERRKQFLISTDNSGFVTVSNKRKNVSPGKSA